MACRPNGGAVLKGLTLRFFVCFPHRQGRVREFCSCGCRVRPPCAACGAAGAQERNARGAAPPARTDMKQKNSFVVVVVGPRDESRTPTPTLCRGVCDMSPKRHWGTLGARELEGWGGGSRLPRTMHPFVSGSSRFLHWGV